MATEIKPKIIQLECIFTFSGLRCQQYFDKSSEKLLFALRDFWTFQKSRKFFLTRTYFYFKKTLQYNGVLMTGASKGLAPLFYLVQCRMNDKGVRTI